MAGGNVHYELSEQTCATAYGGRGAIHTMAHRVGWGDEIDRTPHLLKVRLPHPENDHALNVAYKIVRGGQRLEDIERRRQKESFLEGLGAQRIPDPTPAGDFTRRFHIEDIARLQACINRTRRRVWQPPPEGFGDRGLH